MEMMGVMGKTSWGITHNIVDDIILISIYGMFDRIIFKAYLTTILQDARNINSLIFQMKTLYVPVKNDFPELIRCIKHLKVIKKIAIIVSNKLQITETETSLRDLIPKDMRVKICSDGHSAIQWVIPAKPTRWTDLV